MKFLSSVCMVGVMLSLTACTFKKHTEVEALNEIQAVGSPFTQHLTDEYREFANYELNTEYDYPDAIHFARKGLATASGKVVMPEPIVDWNLNVEHQQELATARGRLVKVLDLGARSIAPREAAHAQAKFDCWVEQQEENWQDDDIASCKSEFLAAIDALEALIGPAPEPVVEAMPPIAMEEEEPAEQLQPKDAMYLVFFDFDESTVEAAGQSVLDAIANEVTSRNLNLVRVLGHTDSSGPNAYNEKLALKRANAVRDGLIARGVDAGLIKVDARGELDLLVKTIDNIREPANRRVEVTFN